MQRRPVIQPMERHPMTFRHLYYLFHPVFQLVVYAFDTAIKVLASPAAIWPAIEHFALIAYRKIRPLKPAYRESYRTDGLSLYAGFAC